MPKYTDVTNDVLSIANEVIREYHPVLSSCNIGFVFRDEAPTTGGKTVLAKTSKVNDQIKPLLSEPELDVLIVISEDTWVTLGEMQRRALIDHELCHIQYADDNGNSMWKVSTVHDIEEFLPVIERYGLWNASLFKAASTLKKVVQLEMTLGEMRAGKVTAISAERLNENGR